MQNESGRVASPESIAIHPVWDSFNSGYRKSMVQFLSVRSGGAYTGMCVCGGVGGGGGAPHGSVLAMDDMTASFYSS